MMFGQYARSKDAEEEQGRFTEGSYAKNEVAL